VECTINSVFCGGTVYGLLLGVIIGIIFNGYRENRGRMGQQNRPLDTFPDSTQSRTTSRQVVGRSRRASIGCVFFMFLGLIAIIGIPMLTNYLLDNWIRILFNC